MVHNLKRQIYTDNCYQLHNYNLLWIIDNIYSVFNVSHSTCPLLLIQVVAISALLTISNTIYLNCMEKARSPRHGDD